MIPGLLDIAKTESLLLSSSGYLVIGLTNLGNLILYSEIENIAINCEQFKRLISLDHLNDIVQLGQS